MRHLHATSPSPRPGRWTRRLLTAAAGIPLVSIATSPLAAGQDLPPQDARLRGLSRFHAQWIPGDRLPRADVQLHGLSTDRDQDGLSNLQEVQGWLVVVDEAGYGTNAPSGLLTVRHVQSDPDRADTDGDGLNDWEEFLIKSDPNRGDTDGDGLGDRAEWRRWLTSPNSVDSDSDSRGPDHDGAPNASLFDWAEIHLSGTSPTLEDTDGDGRTDDEELDEPALSPLIAELPRAEIDVVGDVDVRLSVEYAESIGQATEYGVSMSESTASGQSSSAGGSESSSFASHQETSSSLSVGGEVGWGLPPSVTGTVEATEGESSGTSSEVGNEKNWSSTNESSVAAEEAHSSYRSDSLEYTESFSSGSIRTGIRIRNDGPVTFTLTNIGIGILQWERARDPGMLLEGGFKTMGTLLPQIDSFTLAPGQSTPVLEAAATDVDAAVIKGFLANPGSLVFQPSSFDLQDADGIDFDFITETTFTRTALVEIDFGGGDVHVYRVATNVQRAPGGAYVGIDMKTVMQDILGIPYTVEEVIDYSVAPPLATGVRVLASVDGRQYENPPGQSVLPTAFWTLISEDFVAGTLTSFEDVRLTAGDHVRLVYTRDSDRDGVFEVEEKFFGSSDQSADSDGDGVEDYVEVKEGWIVSGPGAPRRVHSDPRLADGDQDGLDDADELAVGTDPAHPDTDGDSLLDGADPYPLIPARQVYVAQQPNSGWLAHEDLTNAIFEAFQANANADPSDDVAEIWVARGIYKPSISSPTSSFELHPGVAIYGGFLGGETKRGQRDPNPLTNQTILSGELSGQDAYHVVVTAPTADRSAVLDGFAIVGGHADGPGDGDQRGGGVLAVRPAALRNLLVYDNYARTSGGGIWCVGGDPDLYSIEGCTILANRTSGAPLTDGAGVKMLRSGAVRDCVVSQNGPVAQGGGIHMGAPILSGDDGSTYGGFAGIVERCTVANNSAGLIGGGVYLQRGRVDRCDLISNNGGSAGGGVAFIASDPSSTLSVVNSRIWNNQVPGGLVGGGINAGSFAAGFPELRVVNCSVVGNQARGIEGGGFAGTTPTTVTVRNSVLWGNTSPSGTLEQAQVSASGGVVDLGFSTIEGLSNYFGPGLIGTDPGFVNVATGNLRLSPTSPCIDTGTNLVDLDPTQPGLQPLPALDLDGNARLADGDGFGGATVDMGAYERP